MAEGTNEVVVHAYCLRMLTVLIMPWLESRLDASLLAEERNRDGAEFVAEHLILANAKVWGDATDTCAL